MLWYAINKWNDHSYARWECIEKGLPTKCGSNLWTHSHVETMSKGFLIGISLPNIVSILNHITFYNIDMKRWFHKMWFQWKLWNKIGVLGYIICPMTSSLFLSLWIHIIDNRLIHLVRMFKSTNYIWIFTIMYHMRLIWLAWQLYG